ncbi:hypothetical protein MtrunA17_Chr4g0004311 [Medicago truncatula]|uniref:Transmembrane protein n=1 Tax=Medicago truncatula TaxID=3880 RepID=A0A396HZ84_MEDTR|nr:hypothetical protein MtrunA17_Chr4g0004311 [Medicago truncatula]
MLTISLINMLLCIGVILLYSCGVHTPHLFITCQIKYICHKERFNVRQRNGQRKNNRGSLKTWTHVEEPLHHRRRVYKSRK